ncbi:MAG: hypothetical protein ACTHMO_03865 [Rhodanobacteraceae bacterium]
MIQRLRDALHERAIARQAKVFSETHGAAARREWDKLEKLILARSPEQVARQERAIFKAMDPHAQRTYLDSKASEGR